MLGTQTPPAPRWNTRLRDSRMQRSSLAHDKLGHGSRRSHYEKGDLGVQFGCGSYSDLFSRCLKGKSEITGSEPNVTIPGSDPYDAPLPAQETLHHRALEDVSGTHFYRSQLERVYPALERWFADAEVRAKHSKAVNEGVGSLFHHRNVLHTKATPNQHQYTSRYVSQKIPLSIQLEYLVLELQRTMLEVETFLSRDNMRQYSMDDLEMAGSPNGYNSNHEQFSKAGVDPTDAGGIKNDGSSQRPLSTSGHRVQQKQHNRGSKDGKREDRKDEGEDDRYGGESPGRNGRRLSETETPGRQFACPYQKRFSDRLPPKFSSCSFLGFPTVNLMKEHLYREHTRLEPERPDISDNSMYAQSCEESLQRVTENLASSEFLNQYDLRLTHAQVDELKRAPESDPEDERWVKAWRIIFGNDKEALENIPSPYYNTPLDRSPLFDERHERWYKERIFHEFIQWITSQIRADHPDLNEAWTCLLPDFIRSVQHKQCYPSPDSVQSSIHTDPMDDQCSCIDQECGPTSSPNQATDDSSGITPSEFDHESPHVEETFGEPSELHNLTDAETSSALHLLASLQSVIQQHCSSSDSQRVFYFFSGLLKDILQHRSVPFRESNGIEASNNCFTFKPEPKRNPSSTNIEEGAKTHVSNHGSSSSSPSNFNRQELNSPEGSAAGGTMPGGLSPSGRKRSADDESGPGGGRGPGKRKRAKNVADDGGKRLACPYFKRWPRSSAIGRACILPGFPDPNRLTEHLKRCHKLDGYPCYSCFQCFKTTREAQDHIRNQSCPGNGEKRIGYTPDQQMQLNAIKRKLSHEEKWRQIWRILFADDEDALRNIPSPYSGNTVSICFNMMRHSVEDLPEVRQREATQLLDNLSTIFTSENVISGGDENIVPSSRTSSLPETPESADTSGASLAHPTETRDEEAQNRTRSIQQMDNRTHGQPISCISTGTQALSPQGSAEDTGYRGSVLPSAASEDQNRSSVSLETWNDTTLQGSFFDAINESWASAANAESFTDFDTSALGPQVSMNPYPILHATALSAPPFSNADNPGQTPGDWDDYSLLQDNTWSLYR